MLKQSINLVSARRDHHQATLVFYLFIASLTMFFLASLMTYCLIRTSAFRPDYHVFDPIANEFIESSLQFEPLRVPISFWFSTGLLILISLALQNACWCVHREQQKKFRRYLVWSLAMAVAFVVAQSIGMRELFRHHFTETNGSTKIYGMSFTLAFVHALHVLGGITFLGFVLVQSFRSRYDHERHWAVDHCTGYWHFLDIVWFGMLLVFVVLR